MATDIHATAVEAEKAAEQLATGLAEAGVDPNTVNAVKQIAEVLRKIVLALGKGQAATGNNEPPEEPGSFGQAAAETHEAMSQGH